MKQLRIKIFTLLTCLFLTIPLVVMAEEPSADDLEKIAKMTANPIGAAWMLWTQNDYSRLEGDLISGHEYVNSTKFQPVMPFPVTIGGEDWNLLVRPVFQYQSVPLDKDAGKLFGLGADTIRGDPGLSGIATNAFDGRTTGLGDTALLTLLGPNRLDGAVWGVGLTQIFPTAAEDVLGRKNGRQAQHSCGLTLPLNPVVSIMGRWRSTGGHMRGMTTVPVPV